VPTKVLVVYYSVHGHVETLARAVGEGAESVRNTEVRLRRVRGVDDGPRRHAEDEATIDDVRWADGIAWGTPTRYGMMATPLKRFLDGLVDVWKHGELEDKPTGVFTSTASIHGGQESTILTTHAVRAESTDHDRRCRRRITVWSLDCRRPRRSTRSCRGGADHRAQSGRTDRTCCVGAQDR